MEAGRLVRRLLKDRLWPDDEALTLSRGCREGRGGWSPEAARGSRVW